MKLLCRVAIVLALVAPSARAADDKDHPECDKKTAEVMKKLGPVIKDAKSLRTEGNVEITITPDEGDKQVIKTKVAVEFQRPNMFAMRVKMDKDEKFGLDVVSDGKTLFIHDKKNKQYIEKAGPKGLDAVGQQLLTLGESFGMLFQNVLAADPTEALLDGVTKGVHAGMEKVDGKECHHLKFEQEGLDWELWVAAEGPAYVLKAKSTRELPNMKLVCVETYSNWKQNADPTKDAFSFTPPEGSKKVKSLSRQRGGDDDE